MESCYTVETAWYVGLRFKPKLRNFRIYLINHHFQHQNELTGTQRGLLMNWHNVSSGCVPSISYCSDIYWGKSTQEE